MHNHDSDFPHGMVLMLWCALLCVVKIDLLVFNANSPSPTISTEREREREREHSMGVFSILPQSLQIFYSRTCKGT